MEKLPIEFSLEDLLKGKATSIKGKEYLPTEGYVTPFLERVSKLTSDIRVHAKLPDQLTYNDRGDIDTANITFNRVWLEAVLPHEYQYENHQQVIGMVYGLDTRKAIIKFYSGALNAACTNLCVFNPDSLVVREIEPEQPVNYKPVMELVEQTVEIGTTLRMFHNTEFDYTDPLFVNEKLGRWVRNCMTCSFDNGFGKVKLATSTPIDAYKLMFDKQDSPYYLNANNANMFNVYNAFTQIITDSTKKDVMNQVEKTLLVNDILMR
jgi:hypothetical protein